MKIEILVAGAWTDITDSVLVENCRLRYAFGNDDFRYAPDTFDFSIRGRNLPLIKSFLRSTKKVEIRVFADPVSMPDPNDPNTLIQTEEHLFQGDIEAGSSITIEDNYGNLSLSAYDLCDRLRVPCPTLVRIGDDLKTLAEVICTHAGLSFNFPNEVSNSIVQYLVVEQDDEDCLTLLDRMMWEFGWTLYYDPVNGVSARTWWFTNTANPSTTLDAAVDSLIEPLEIEERELDFDILSVEWTVADQIIRTDEDKMAGGCQGGLLLYRNSREDQSISAGEYLPARGLVSLAYQRYNARTAPDIVGGSGERSRIIYAWDQCVNFVVGDDAGQIMLVVEEHSGLRSRIVFQNQDTVARELRRFEIRGSAIYSQGVGISTVAAFSESESFNIASIDRSNPARVTITLPNSANATDNFYNNYRLVSANGTNAIITGYAGAPFYVATIDTPMMVSTLDSVGTEVTLISPTTGIREEKKDTKHLYSQQEGNNLAEAIKNVGVYGRNTVRFDMKQEDSPPRLGTYVRFKYDHYSLDYVGVVFYFEYTPDEIDRPRVNIGIKGISEYIPQRSYLRAASYPNPQIGDPNEGPPGPPGSGGVGQELIYAVTDSPNLLLTQRPLNSWGYKSPGTVGGLQWSTQRPSQ